MHSVYYCIQVMQLTMICCPIIGQIVLAADGLICYHASHKLDILAASDFADSM